MPTIVALRIRHRLEAAGSRSGGPIGAAAMLVARQAKPAGGGLQALEFRLIHPAPAPGMDGIDTLFMLLRHHLREPDSLLVTFGGSRVDVPVLWQVALANGRPVGRLPAGVSGSESLRELGARHLDLEHCVRIGLTDLKPDLVSLLSESRPGPSAGPGLAPDFTAANDLIGGTALFLLYCRWLAITEQLSPRAFRGALLSLWEVIRRLRPPDERVEAWVAQQLRSSATTRLMGSRIRL